MWSEKGAWMHYVKNIIAADMGSAMFLASYLRSCSNTKNYAVALEIIDLQKYKVIREPVKVKVALNHRIRIPFVFVIGKN